MSIDILLLFTSLLCILSAIAVVVQMIERQNYVFYYVVCVVMGFVWGFGGLITVLGGL